MPLVPDRNRVLTADPELPATVYVVASVQFTALKVGVTSDPEARITAKPEPLHQAVRAP